MDHYLLSPSFWMKGLVVWLAVFSGALSQAAIWKTIPNCELDDNAYADGDSFHVRAGSRNYIIRLYFVDCAETNENFPERNADQAAYWKVDAKRVLQLGEEATRFTKKKLAGRFTVITKMEDARGESNQHRYYGFVLPAEGKENLAELLVANGLARVYGATARPPEGPDVEAFRQTLQRLESRAKTQKLGGWGGQIGNPNDDFFKRSKASSAAVPPGAAGPLQEIRINLNTASAGELESLPKIGKVLAERIIAGRPYAKIEDVANVPGLSAKVVTAITPLVCVAGN